MPAARALFFFRPPPLAAINPIFCPGGAPCEVVVPFRALLLLLPYGCAAATIALPRVLGYLRPLALIKWNFDPDFKKGFSVLPAPEPTPIVALQ